MKRANTMSTITVELTIKVKNKFTSSNAEKTNGFISRMSEIFTTLAEESWCPPVPDTADDPTKNEIAGAADKLETMMNGSQPQIFSCPSGLVATGPSR